MKYIITDTSIIRLSEKSGVIQNVSSGDKVELSNSRNFTDSIILFPLNHFSFETQLYVKASQTPVQAIELRVVPFSLNSGYQGHSGDSGASDGISDEEVADDDDVDDFLDDIFKDL